LIIIKKKKHELKLSENILKIEIMTFDLWMLNEKKNDILFILKILDERLIEMKLKLM
jgi:hypothetical protein